MTAPAAKKKINGAAKGAAYERALADYFEALGYDGARRMIRTGTVKHADEGDLHGLPFTVQAKTKKTDPGDAELVNWMVATAAQRVARGDGVGLLIVKRNGHSAAGASRVYLPLVQLVFLTGAGYRQIADCSADAAVRACLRLDDVAPMLLRRYPPVTK